MDPINLARRGPKEFQAHTPSDDGWKVADLCDVTNLTHNKVARGQIVVVASVQRMHAFEEVGESFYDALEEGAAFSGRGVVLLCESPLSLARPLGSMRCRRSARPRRFRWTWCR